MNSGRITSYISNRSMNDSERMSMSRNNQKFEADSILDKEKSNPNSRDVSRERDFSMNIKENTTKGRSTQIFKDKSFKLDLSSLNESKQAAKDNINEYKNNQNGVINNNEINTKKVNLNMSQYDSTNKRSIVDEFINI